MPTIFIPRTFGSTLIITISSGTVAPVLSEQVTTQRRDNIITATRRDQAATATRRDEVVTTGSRG